ncbi:hypothetical protein IFM53868_02264 [Aspergillus udagawae]|uniref:Uncharacterized protein n=1 Tax=Aspergillus udagawae TaxID=91492 RepID=A0ABQ1ABG2_9EURO|nr:hypothetical protein IFM53868_02264 [Aspergillus udagawae]GFG05300.1 hypothetical protein IFM5058_02352 [Aspergillus udagawae]
MKLVRVPELWRALGPKGLDQESIRELLREILQSNPVYTGRKVNAAIADAIRGDIETYIDRMPQCIKAKYHNNGPDTVQNLYELALSVKIAMKKDRRTPTPGRSQAPQTPGRSSEPAVMPAVTPASSQVTQPHMLTQFRDHQVLIKFGPGQSRVQGFILSQFCKPGTLQSAPYIDQSELDWSMFTDALEECCGWRQDTHHITCDLKLDDRHYENTIFGEKTWIGALGLMLPGPIIFNVKRNIDVSTPNPAQSPQGIPFPSASSPPPISGSNPSRRPRSPVEEAITNINHATREHEQEQRKRQLKTENNSDSDIPTRKRAKRVGRR